jgi:hypothetical protein
MNPTLVLIAAPTDEVVGLAALKKHLNVDHGDDDEFIEALRDAVVDQLDPAGGGWLGRALRPQTWELRARCFPTGCVDGIYGALKLPYPPFIEVVSVKYDDQSGAEQTLVEGTDYRLLGVPAAADSAPPPGHRVSLAPLFNRFWPVTRYDAESVRVRWRCGYAPAVTGDGAHDDYLPPRVPAWVKLVVGSLYENRESVVINKIGHTVIPVLPDHIINMLSTLRVY